MNSKESVCTSHFSHEVALQLFLNSKKYESKSDTIATPTQVESHTEMSSLSELDELNIRTLTNKENSSPHQVSQEKSTGTQKLHELELEFNPTMPMTNLVSAASLKTTFMTPDGLDMAKHGAHPRNDCTRGAIAKGLTPVPKNLSQIEVAHRIIVNAVKTRMDYLASPLTAGFQKKFTVDCRIGEQLHTLVFAETNKNVEITWSNAKKPIILENSSFKTVHEKMKLDPSPSAAKENPLFSPPQKLEANTKTGQTPSTPTKTQVSTRVSEYKVKVEKENSEPKRVEANKQKLHAASSTSKFPTHIARSNIFKDIST